MTVQSAEKYLKTTARPLERALYTGGDVLAELAQFQNSDGGFGHGLEPDIQADISSVIVTTIAFQRLRQINAPANHPVVVKACEYLRATYNPHTLDWPSVPSGIDSAPHAPWWGNGGVHSLANPRAEIIGYLYDYAVHFPVDMRETLTQSALHHLRQAPDDMEMHDALCYLRLHATTGLPADAKKAMTEHLTRILKKIVSTDLASWQGYGLPPLAVVETPDSPFAPLFAASIPANLDFVVSQQNADGSWSPNWSWADVFPEGWKKAERGWRSVITLNNTQQLQAFGRAF